MIKYFYIY